MEQMREIVDVAAFERVLLALAIAGPVVGLMLGLLVGARRGAIEVSCSRGIAIGFLGPILLGMWRLYSYLVRFDPATGYVGLHRVSVLLLNVAIFVVVGAGLGAFYGWLLRQRRPDRGNQSPGRMSEGSRS